MSLQVTNLTLALIFAVAPIGAFDAIYYHIFKQKLAQRPESWNETKTHILRSLLMGTIVFLLTVFKVHGFWFWITGALFALDFTNNIIDVYLEHESRRSQGGLPRLEYVIHIIGATSMGAVSASYFYEFWNEQLVPTGLSYSLNTFSLPFQVNALMIILGSVALAIVESYIMISSMQKRQAISCCRITA